MGVREGYRNGYEPKRLKTAEGGLMLEAPQLKGTEESYRSEFLRRIDALSPQLKRLEKKGKGPNLLLTYVLLMSLTVFVYRPLRIARRIKNGVDPFTQVVESFSTSSFLVVSLCFNSALLLRIRSTSIG